MTQIFGDKLEILGIRKHTFKQPMVRADTKRDIRKHFGVKKKCKETIAKNSGIFN